MKKKFLISFFTALVSFTLIFSGIAYKIFKLDKDSKTMGEKIEIEGSDLGEGNEIGQKIKNEILFLLAGVDSDDINKTNTRTDTMMLMKVNFNTGKIDILSIPRDTRVKINGKTAKINSAHNNGGMALTLRTLREFLNLDIDYYVKVDYKLVMDVVDAIGGVEIDVPFRMKYDDTTKGFTPLHIDLQPGLQVLDGKNAHDFLRWRKNNDLKIQYAEGDVGRIKTQQYFMKELIKQTLKPKNIFKLPTLLETYYKNVETNIPLKIVSQGMKLANKIDSENINAVVLPGEGKTIGGTSYFIHDESETKKVIEDVFSDYMDVTSN